MSKIPSVIKFRRGNGKLGPSLLNAGEPAFNVDTGRLYIGTGLANYIYYGHNEIAFLAYPDTAFNSSLKGVKIGLPPAIPVNNAANNTVIDLRTYYAAPDAPPGINATLTGYNTKATGPASFVGGNGGTSAGDSSVVFGKNNTASGVAAVALGHGTTSETFGLLTLGAGNTVSTGSASSFSNTQNALVIGNGGLGAVKSNAFRVSYDGKVYGLSAFNSTGADYAEFFEWDDGNPNNKDRVGRFVCLKKDKIVIANWINAVDIIGVVSHSGAIVGNSSSEGWNDKYVKDDFGRIIYDERTDEEGNIIKTAKVNPAYDPTIEYIPRDRRCEWDPVGMLGRLRTIDDGTCYPGGNCRCGTNGIAINSDKGFKVLRRISEKVVEILFK